MAIQVSLENNILKIDNGVDIEYLNAAWCSMRFTLTEIYISSESIYGNNKSRRILLTDFQDGDSTPITTEATIATYLSDKIG